MNETTRPRIRLIGNALVDQVMRLPRWPRPDEELRATGFERRSGGNTANTARALAEAGCAAEVVCALADDADGEWLRQTLRRTGVDLALAPVLASGRTPLSSVWLVESRATRNIVHFRDLPELSGEYLAGLDHEGVDWLHLEGRNVEGLAAMLPARGIAREHCSLELEKPRHGLEALLDAVGVAIVSADYLRRSGETVTAAMARLQRQFPHLRLVCTQGAEGVWLAEAGATPLLQPPPEVLMQGDSLGAGDRFIAGLIATLAQGCPLEDAVANGQQWVMQQMAGKERT